MWCKLNLWAISNLIIQNTKDNFENAKKKNIVTGETPRAIIAPFDIFHSFNFFDFYRLIALSFKGSLGAYSVFPLPLSVIIHAPSVYRVVYLLL